MTNVVWTPLMAKCLEKLIDENIPYHIIAECLSAQFKVKLTKNSCIGKGRRLGVSLRIAPRKRQCQPRRDPKSHERRRLLNVAREKRLLKRKRESQQPRRNLILLQLQENSCRFPLGGQHSPPFRYCGAHTQDGSSYCPEHHAMTHYRSRS
jgi:hypothetical protein